MALAKTINTKNFDQNSPKTEFINLNKNDMYIVHLPVLWVQIQNLMNWSCNHKPYIYTPSLRFIYW